MKSMTLQQRTAFNQTQRLRSTPQQHQYLTVAAERACPASRSRRLESKTRMRQEEAEVVFNFKPTREPGVSVADVKLAETWSRTIKLYKWQVMLCFLQLWLGTNNGSQQV